MAGLTELTWTRIRELFPPELHSAVADILEHECGDNLPFLESADPSALDRFRLAALALSQGTMAGLREAVELAQTDWRDLLLAAEATESSRLSRWPWRRRQPPTSKR